MSRKLLRFKPAASLLAIGLFALNTIVVMAEPIELSLDDSIAMALENNPAIKMAVNDKEKASWGIKEAETGNLPTLSLQQSGSRSSNMAGSLPNDNFNTSLRVNWPIYSGGRTEGIIDQAKINANIANLGIEKAKNQLKLDATTAYFNVLQARNLAKVNQQAVDNLNEHLKQVQAQFDAGVVAKGDVLQSEVQLANAQQNLTKAQNSYDLAVASLNNIIGIPMDSQDVLKDDLNYAECEISLDDSIKLAFENRPDIAQSKSGIDVAEAGVRVADSGKRPTVSLSGTNGWSGSEFPGQNNNWSVGITANWNIFDAGLTSAKIEQAKISLDKAGQQAEQIRDSVELEVRQAYLSMKEAEQRVQTSQVAVEKASEDLKISQAKYYAGAGTNLDVIDAQLASTQAQTNYTQSLYDYNVNKAKLEKAIGSSIK